MNLPWLGIDIAKVKFNVCLLQLTGKLKHKLASPRPPPPAVPIKSQINIQTNIFVRTPVIYL